jgi:hypothetical protein
MGEPVEETTIINRCLKEQTYDTEEITVYYLSRINSQLLYFT